MVNVETLQRFSIFSGMDPDVLESIARISMVQTYRAMEQCMVEGEEAENLFILMKGRMIVKRHLSQSWLHAEGITDAVVDTVREGEVFGWSAVVQPTIRTASVWCAEDCEVIAMSGKEFVAIMDKHPEVGYVFMKRLAAVIASRLARTVERLSTMTAEVETFKVT